MFTIVYLCLLIFEMFTRACLPMFTHVHTLQLVVKVFETAPAYSRRVNSELAIAKKVNWSCRATAPDAASWKKIVKKCPKPYF